MNKLINAPRRIARRLVSPLRPQSRSSLAALPAFAIAADAIEALHGAQALHQALLEEIAQATRRIVVVALYLQDDEAGREVMDALYAAHVRQPGLEIDVFVDWHRAQRGLIGKHQSPGNAAMYRDYARRHGAGVRVWGVPVQNRELFGVLHLKGFVFDDTVLYSGASLNDIYLAKHGRYRLDRCHRLRDAALADSLAAFALRQLRDSEAVRRLDLPDPPPTRTLLPAIRAFRQQLQQANYTVPNAALPEGVVAVTPLKGFGRADNALNDAMLALLRGARQRIVLLTPYFNLPGPVRAALGQALRRGCRVEIMVGDKAANDFYIPPTQPFRTIGLLPYLYENNLRRFARVHARQIASGQLDLWLWRDGDNSYHLKGLFVDEDCALLTGHNLNPRAWALDLENALLLRDPSRRLHAMHETEWATLRAHATRLANHHALPSARSYPPEVRRLLRRLSRVRLDRLVNRLL